MRYFSVNENILIKMSRMIIFWLEVIFTIISLTILICLCVFAKNIKNVQPEELDEEEETTNEDDKEPETDAETDNGEQPTN